MSPHQPIMFCGCMAFVNEQMTRNVIKWYRLTIVARQLRQIIDYRSPAEYRCRV